MITRVSQRLLPYLPLMVLAFVLVRTAWSCDDAEITFRSVLNWTAGSGPVFNPGERVQSFSHPLWFLLLTATYLVIGHLAGAALVLSFVLTLLAVAFLLRTASSPASAFLAGAVCLLSKAFVDFATSGLENPLAYALVAASASVLFAAEPAGPRLERLSLVAGLVVFTRLDLVLLVAPAWILVLFRAPTRRAAGAMLFFAGPTVLWMAFSTFYYGFPLPNTAHAKLWTGYDRLSLATQGGRYLLDSLTYDPLTLLVIGAGVAFGLGFRCSRQRAWTAGLVLYLAYVCAIGGDFMSGRFLAVPLLAAACLLVRGDDRYRHVLTASILLVGLLLGPPWNPRPRGGLVGSTGIADERLFVLKTSEQSFWERAGSPIWRRATTRATTRCPTSCQWTPSGKPSDSLDRAPEAPNPRQDWRTPFSGAFFGPPPTCCCHVTISFREPHEDRVSRDNGVLDAQELSLSRDNGQSGAQDLP